MSVKRQQRLRDMSHRRICSDYYGAIYLLYPFYRLLSRRAEFWTLMDKAKKEKRI